MESPQGLAAVTQKPVLQWPPSQRSTVLGAYQIQDPGNLGTLFRSAEAFGVSGLYLAGGCCDPFNPKAIRASMGSLFRLPFKKEESWEECFRGLRSDNFRIFALTSQGEKSLLDMSAPDRSAFWVGSEGSGLPEELTAACDEKVRIPMDGKVESLNAGVAASLALFCSRFKGGFLDPDGKR
jgi:TrmH family RNA methyltransferase